MLRNQVCVHNNNFVHLYLLCYETKFVFTIITLFIYICYVTKQSLVFIIVCVHNKNFVHLYLLCYETKFVFIIITLFIYICYVTIQSLCS